MGLALVIFAQAFMCWTCCRLVHSSGQYYIDNTQQLDMGPL